MDKWLLFSHDFDIDYMFSESNKYIWIKLCSKWDYKNAKLAGKNHIPNYNPTEVLKFPNALEMYINFRISWL